MKPILLIHGYSSEGNDISIEDIYGTLPGELRSLFGDKNVQELNLSRWISLNDGVTLDDVSFAMERALREKFSRLLASGFHVIIHSTGALVVRNWIKNFSPKPCPINNLVHLAGANFGSGLAHIGQGQLARWGRLIFMGTDRGYKILNELEFGSWKTLDLHKHFLLAGNDMYRDYQVQEFCIAGSQVPPLFRPIPIRYVKEDSSDNTVRTSAVNLNFNYLCVRPKPTAFGLTIPQLNELKEKRLQNLTFPETNYEPEMLALSEQRQTVPFTITYETAHFGEDIGIVSGNKNRKIVMPLIKLALETTYDPNAYKNVADKFELERQKTFDRVGKLKASVTEWNKQAQYEGHAQLIFRLRDQFGNGIEHFDITLKSTSSNKNYTRLESMIEDHHTNTQCFGTITFYLRTQKFDGDSQVWCNLLDSVGPVNIEITAEEIQSQDISFVPLNYQLTANQVRNAIQSFRTTIIDVTLARLPSPKVFAIKAV